MCLFNDAFDTFYFTVNWKEGWKEMFLFNDALIIFYFTVNWKEGRKCVYLTTHSTHFIYVYLSDIWKKTILIVRKETRCRHMGYSFRLAARVLLYASSPQTGQHIPRLLLHQLWSTVKLIQIIKMKIHCPSSRTTL